MSAEAASLQPGIVFGRYLLQRPIGRGGMAEVWRAQLIGVHDFARPVVVKRILPHLSQSPEFGEMFTAEAKLCARLNHPNIVHVFEFSSVGGELFLAMEHVDGINMVEAVRRLPPDVPIPVGMAAQIVRDVCRALAYAHTALGEDGNPMCIIHRDVSPSNVMLTFGGSVKLLDFGIAKVLRASDDQTRTGILKGKMGYLSPEAATGEVSVDHRTDLFSAGVLLYELLTRQRLFKGLDDLNTLALVRACNVEPPSLLRAGLAPEIDAICLQALARDREQRFATADEMAEALTQVLRTLAWDELATAKFLRDHGIQAPLAAATPGTVVATATQDPGPRSPSVDAIATVLAPADAATVSSGGAKLRTSSSRRAATVIVAAIVALVVIGGVIRSFERRSEPDAWPEVAGSPEPTPAPATEPRPAEARPAAPPAGVAHPATTVSAKRPTSTHRTHAGASHGKKHAAAKAVARSRASSKKPGPAANGPDLIGGDIDDNFNP